MAGMSSNGNPERWEKIVAFAFGVTFIVVMLAITALIPRPTETQWFVFRLTLAASAAGLGAVIPGLIVLNVKKVVRAGGAIALFVLVYWFNPPKLIKGDPQPIKVNQVTNGKGSPAVANVDGPVTITIGPDGKQKPDNGKPTPESQPETKQH